MQELVRRDSPRILRLVSVVVLLVAVAFGVYHTIHWQVCCDPSIMHYVNFSMDQGQAPYRDIIDINMPGCYFIEGWAMHIFGGGDLGWRIFDACLLALLTLAAAVIARPYDWVAGLFTGVAFALIHFGDGPRDSAQREQVMATLILLGYAALFVAGRARKPVWMLPFGLALGLAATLKPTALPLALVLVLMLIYILRRQRAGVLPYCGWALLGWVLPVLYAVFFFVKYHAFADFLKAGHVLVPYYASIGNSPLPELLKGLFQHHILGPLVVGIGLAFAQQRGLLREENWERLALGLGICFGATSYMVQRKAFEHHAYTFVIFVLLFFSVEAVKAMRASAIPVRVVGLASFAIAVFVFVPRETLTLSRLDRGNTHEAAMAGALQADLETLGGGKLQHQVQCLDEAGECLTALYRLKLVQSANFMGDYMLFGPLGSPPLPAYRTLFWDDMHRNPPGVIVLTNTWLCQGYSFKLLDQWPEFAAYLNSTYTLERTRVFGGPGSDMAYRIYILKSSPAPLGILKSSPALLGASLVAGAAGEHVLNEATTTTRRP